MGQRRLFTFGCSYTFYGGGPTWADFLGLEFEHHQNWGLPGIGCRAIAERVAESHVKNHFTKNDIIIVQWSTHLRNDYHNPMNTVYGYRSRTPTWRTDGSVFSDLNQKLYNDSWFAQFFYEPSYIMHCLNYMIMVQNLLENIGCTWYMTSIGEWCKLSSDLDLRSSYTEVIPREVEPDKVTIEKTTEFIPYIEKIWKEHADQWLEPIALHAQSMPDDWQWFADIKNLKKYREMHPSPKQYCSWLNTNLRPKLALEETPKEQSLWVETLEKVRLMCYYKQQEYCKLINSEDPGVDGWWPNQKDWPIVMLGL
jgi:hypothetical protein